MSISSVSSAQQPEMIRSIFAKKAAARTEQHQGKPAQANPQPADPMQTRRLTMNQGQPVPMTSDAANLAANLTQASSQSPVNQTPISGEGGDETGQGTLTLEGLLAAWGQSDTPYDLNGDGSVGVSDMLIMLDNGGSMAMPENESEPLTLSGLLGAWGTDNPTFDLNEDGTVNTSDLLALLKQMSEGDQPQPVSGGGLDDSKLPANMTRDSLLSHVRTHPDATEKQLELLKEMLG